MNIKEKTRRICLGNANNISHFSISILCKIFMFWIREERNFERLLFHLSVKDLFRLLIFQEQRLEVKRRRGDFSKMIAINRWEYFLEKSIHPSIQDGSHRDEWTVCCRWSLLQDSNWAMMMDGVNCPLTLSPVTVAHSYVLHSHSHSWGSSVRRYLAWNSADNWIVAGIGLLAIW